MTKNRWQLWTGVATVTHIFGLFFILLATVDPAELDAPTFPQLLVPGIILAVFGFGLAIFLVVRVARKSRAIKKINTALATTTTPYAVINDYREELEIVRRKFASDKNPNKNHIERDKMVYGKFADGMFDYGVIRTGQVYYACLISAPPMAFKKMIGKSVVFNGVMLASLDQDFQNDPTEYAELWDRIQAADDENVFWPKKEKAFTKKLPDHITDGREVYLKTIPFTLSQLPSTPWNGAIVPIVASESSSSAFVVDSRYWSESLVSSFMYKTSYWLEND